MRRINYLLIVIIILFLNSCSRDGSIVERPLISGQGEDDRDKDGVKDSVDNCPDVANADQADADGDKIGAVCDDNDTVAKVVDEDSDDDGIIDSNDNCPNNPINNHANMDNDEFGDICDSDKDGDGKANTADNCPNDKNADQANADGDNLGDVCDSTPNPANQPLNYLFGSWKGSGIYFKEGVSMDWEKIFNATQAEKIIFGDMDGDDIDDPIAIMNDNGTRKIFIKYSKKFYSNVNYWEQWNSTAPDDYDTCDIDGDKKDDLVAIWGNEGQYPGVWIWNRQTSSWFKVTGGTDVKKIVCGDIHGDGKMDLFSYMDGAMLIIKSVDFTSEKSWALFYGASAQDIAICDMNGDARDDLVISESSGGVIYIHDVSNPNNYQWTQFYNKSAKSITCGDIDGDGMGDVAGIWPSGNLWIHYSKNNDWKKTTGGELKSIAIGKVKLSIFGQ